MFSENNENERKEYEKAYKSIEHLAEKIFENKGKVILFEEINGKRIEVLKIESKIDFYKYKDKVNSLDN